MIPGGIFDAAANAIEKSMRYRQILVDRRSVRCAGLAHHALRLIDQISEPTLEISAATASSQTGSKISMQFLPANQFDCDNPFGKS